MRHEGGPVGPYSWGVLVAVWIGAAFLIAALAVFTAAVVSHRKKRASRCPESDETGRPGT